MIWRTLWSSLIDFHRSMCSRGMCKSAKEWTGRLNSKSQYSVTVFLDLLDFTSILLFVPFSGLLSWHSGLEIEIIHKLMVTLLYLTNAKTSMSISIIRTSVQESQFHSSEYNSILPEILHYIWQLSAFCCLGLGFMTLTALPQMICYCTRFSHSPSPGPCWFPSIWPWNNMAILLSLFLSIPVLPVDLGIYDENFRVILAMTNLYVSCVDD